MLKIPPENFRKLLYCLLYHSLRPRRKGKREGISGSFWVIGGKSALFSAEIRVRQQVEQIVPTFDIDIGLRGPPTITVSATGACAVTSTLRAPVGDHDAHDRTDADIDLVPRLV